MNPINQVWLDRIARQDAANRKAFEQRSAEQREVYARLTRGVTPSKDPANANA